MNDRPDLTMMYSVHLAFRRDIDRLTAAVSSGDIDPVRRAAIMANWDLFHSLLEHHHQAEDRVLWVELLEADPDAAAVVDTMSEQHEALDAALEATHTRMQAWGMDAGDAPLAGLTAVGELLRAHLTDEEEQALPLVGEHLTAWGMGEVHRLQHGTQRGHRLDDPLAGRGQAGRGPRRDLGDAAARDPGRPRSGLVGRLRRQRERGLRNHGGGRSSRVTLHRLVLACLRDGDQTRWSAPATASRWVGFQPPFVGANTVVAVKPAAAGPPVRAPLVPSSQACASHGRSG